MKIQQIRDEVAGLIEDASYDPISIDEKINFSLRACSEEIDIPEFKRVFTIPTSTEVGYVSLNTHITQGGGYGGRVSRVKYDGEDLQSYTSLDELLSDYDDLETAGDIEAYCMQGRILWYAKIPEVSVDLLVLAFLHPEPLSENGNTEALWMPENCQYDILVGGTCKRIFDAKEEEDSGKPVTRRYEAMERSGYTKFRSWIARNRQNLTYSSWTI